MKPKVLLGAVAIIGFTTLLMVNFGNSIGTYSNFNDVQKSRTAHVVGTWDDAKAYGFSLEKKQFVFYMKDEEGTVRKVVYPKPKPNNFEDAKKLVVVGKMENGVFYASSMLMKCPSKYNATGKDVQMKGAKAQQS